MDNGSPKSFCLKLTIRFGAPLPSVCTLLLACARRYPELRSFKRRDMVFAASTSRAPDGLQSTLHIRSARWNIVSAMNGWQIARLMRLFIGFSPCFICANWPATEGGPICTNLTAQHVPQFVENVAAKGR